MYQKFIEKINIYKIKGITSISQLYRLSFQSHNFILFDHKILKFSCKTLVQYLFNGILKM